jgi:hypothetical protein
MRKLKRQRIELFYRFLRRDVLKVSKLRSDESMSEPRIIRGAVAGFASGLAASLVMNIFQSKLSKLFGGEQRSHGAQSQQIGTPAHGAGSYLTKIAAENPDDDAAERTANIVSVAVASQPLSERQKEIGGTIFHYAFGATSGVVYGVASEFIPSVRLGWGLPFGALVWLLADETVVPALGLSKDVRDYPASVIGYALAAHLVYGLATEITLKVLHHTNNNQRTAEI